MKIGLIADPHFANRPMFGSPTKFGKGVNARLASVFNAVNWARTDAFAAHAVEAVVFLGDITHDHGKLTPPVLHLARCAIQRFVDDGIKVYAYAGNHDIDGNGLSNLEAFRFSGVEIVEQAMLRAVTAIDNSAIGALTASAFMPYDSTGRGKTHKTPAEFINAAAGLGAKVVFAHHHFEGARHGAHEFRPPGGVNLKDIPDDLVVLSGHYHLCHGLDLKGKKLGLHPKVMYIGSILQQDFGEAEYQPGVAILDSDTLDLTWEETPPDVAPRFHILSHLVEPDEIPGDRKKHYYRIDLPEDVDSKAIRHLKKALTNVRVSSVPAVNPDLRSRVEEYLAEQQAASISEEDDCIMLDDDEDEEMESPKVTIPAVIEVYAAMHSDDEDRAERLTDLGQDIARSVGVS